MSLYNVYSYYDAAGYRKYADDNDVVFTGTWSSSGSYYASAMQVVNYGQSQYFAVTDSVNQNPSIQPTKWRPTRYWSAFVLIIPAAGTASADSTYQVAVTGSNLAVQAYGTASEALNMAQANTDTLSTGWAGTVSVWAAGSQGGPTNSQLVFVNGILTAYMP